MNKRLNDATPEDWNRLRTNHPALEKPSMLDAWMKAAHNENADLWENESLEDIIARQDEEEEDVVNNPNHYNNGSIECIEGIQASMSTEEFAGYLKGNCMKYLWRYNYKGKPVQDLQKAQWYLAELIKELVFEDEE